METRKRLVPYNSKGELLSEIKEREYIYFTIEYNHFRDTTDTTSSDVTDREDMRECECVLALPDSYSETGPKTPLILSFHGAVAKVAHTEDKIGGVHYVSNCIEAGYAVLDVNGSAPDGITMGCPEHIFAARKAYRYAIRKYNLEENVFVVGASMGGFTALNYSNTFPGSVIAISLFDPSIFLDSTKFGDKEIVGAFDKMVGKNGRKCLHDLVREVYRFPSDEWCEKNTAGFNPYRTRSFINSDGERVVIPPCPIKIWQGLDDTVIPIDGIKEFVASVRRSGSYIELRLLSDTGHTVSHTMKKEAKLWFDRFI